MDDLASGIQVDDIDDKIPEELPILSLRDTVVFPNIVTPLVVAREKSVNLINEVIAGSRMLGLVTQRQAEEAGVTEGLIAHHFGSKENLFLKVEQTILRDLHDKLEESLFYSLDGVGAVTNFIKCLLRYSVDNKEWFTTLLRCSPFILENNPRGNKIITVECEKIFRLLKQSVPSNEK